MSDNVLGGRPPPISSFPIAVFMFALFVVFGLAFALGRHTAPGPYPIPCECPLGDAPGQPGVAVPGAVQ